MEVKGKGAGLAIKQECPFNQSVNKLQPLETQVDRSKGQHRNRNRERKEHEGRGRHKYHSDSASLKPKRGSAVSQSVHQLSTRNRTGGGGDGRHTDLLAVDDDKKGKGLPQRSTSRRTVDFVSTRPKSPNRPPESSGRGQTSATKPTIHSTHSTIADRQGPAQLGVPWARMSHQSFLRCVSFWRFRRCGTGHANTTFVLC